MATTISFYPTTDVATGKVVYYTIEIKTVSATGQFDSLVRWKIAGEDVASFFAGKTVNVENA